MQPRPSFDYALLIPIVIAIVSILGLAWIFLANDRNEPSLAPTLEPSVVPFDPPPRTTRPPTPTPLGPATEASPESYPGPPSLTTLSTETLTSETQPTPPAASTSDAPPVLPAGKYDNTHPNILYDRHWAFKRNAGTTYAYRGTLHISTEIGNEISFRFTGQRFIFGYQRGRSFGTITVLIDDQTYRFHQQARGNVWRSPPLPAGTHSVRLIHESGQSVNLDYIEVIG